MIYRMAQSDSGRGSRIPTVRGFKINLAYNQLKYELNVRD